MKERRTVVMTIAAAGLAILAVAAIALPLTNQTAAPSAPSASAPGGGVAQVPPADPIPWQSVRWTRFETTGIEFARAGQYLTKVTPGATGGMFAFGVGPNPRAAENPDPFDSTLTVWTSPDGRSWRRTPIIAGVPPDGVSEGSDLAAGPGGIVLIGGVCCRVEEPAIWWSRDGLAWERATVQAAAETFYSSVAAGPAGFVIAGGVGELSAAWTSPDGRTWTPVDADVASLERGSLWDVTAFEDGFVLAGQIDSGISDADAAIWRSEGLGGWRRIGADDPALTGDDEAGFTNIVPFASGLLGIGTTGSREERLKCEQLLDGEPLAGPGDIALSCGWSREMNWRSDGERWQRVDPWGADGEYPPELVGPPPGRAQADWAHIVAGGPGLVALQYELVGPGDDDAGDLGLWVSPDGASWSRVGDGPIVATEAVVGILVDGRRVFVMTEAGHAWVGTVGP